MLTHDTIAIYLETNWKQGDEKYEGNIPLSKQTFPVPSIGRSTFNEETEKITLFKLKCIL